MSSCESYERKTGEGGGDVKNSQMLQSPIWYGLTLDILYHRVCRKHNGRVGTDHIVSAADALHGPN